MLPKRRSDLYLGLPAIVITAIAIPGISFIWSREKSLAAEYREDAISSFESGNFARAAICYDRVARIDSRDEDRYNLAVSLLRIGSLEQGTAIMRSLAPDNKPGFGPAHFWWAKRLLQGGDLTTDDLLPATSHLVHAAELMPDDGEPSYLLAGCYWQLGSRQESLIALSEAAKRSEQYYFDLFQACQRLGLVSAANQAASLAEQYLLDRIAQSPEDAQARIRYIQTLMWQERFDTAETILQQGRQVSPGENWGKVESEALLVRFRHEKLKGTDNTELLLEFLEKAFAADPRSTEVLQELTSFGIKDESGRIDQLLKDALASGRHTALVHFVLGSRKWQSGEMDAALFHMRRSYQLDDRLGLAANNLAYHEMSREGGNLDGALELINQVLEKFPEDTGFRETRGQILTKMGKWEAALNDLEVALPDYPNERALHEALVNCYRGLGQTDLADLHVQRLLELTEQELAQGTGEDLDLQPIPQDGGSE
jgi:tetratricopeptide (TPR) repeat protein